jgi:hypothetical protein
MLLLQAMGYGEITPSGPLASYMLVSFILHLLVLASRTNKSISCRCPVPLEMIRQQPIHIVRGQLFPHQDTILLQTRFRH